LASAISNGSSTFVQLVFDVVHIEDADVRRHVVTTDYLTVTETKGLKCSYAIFVLVIHANAIISVRLFVSRIMQKTTQPIFAKSLTSIRRNIPLLRTFSSKFDTFELSC